MAAVDDLRTRVRPRSRPQRRRPRPTTKPPAMPDQQPRWADPIFRAGLMVGSALFVIGIFCQTLNLIAPTLSILIICSGLGIIFGAFGSTAVINYKGVVIAGVAAIAVALLLVVDWVMRESLVRLEVDGDVKGARLELFGDEAYPGADHGGRRFEFFIIGREITKDRLSLIVTLPAAEMERSGAERRARDLLRLHPEHGDHPLHRRRQDAAMALRRRPRGADRRRRRDDQERPVLRRRGYAELRVARPGRRGDGAGRRYRRAPRRSRIRVPPPSGARRGIELAELGEDAVVPMMNYWQSHPDSYPVRLGVSTALTEILRGPKGDRRDIAALLTDSHLQLLAAAAGDPDRNLRIYASEFLYDLGDKRVVPIAAGLFPGASDDGRYNLIVVIRGAVPDLSTANAGRWPRR